MVDRVSGPIAPYTPISISNIFMILEIECARNSDEVFYPPLRHIGLIQTVSCVHFTP